MLGSSCYPCCSDPCGAELTDLPQRFEVDITVVEAPETYLALRYCVAYSSIYPANGTVGYVGSWHCGAVTSGTYTLAYVSTTSGVALYQYVSAGLILKMTCTPNGSGLYSAFLSIVPVRTTVQTWGKWSDLLENGTQIWPIRVHAPDPSYPGRYYLPESQGGPVKLIALSEMQSASTTLTETAVTTGSSPGFTYSAMTFKQACHARTVGTRLACPSATISGTAAANTEVLTSSASIASFSSNNWPMSIRTSCRFYFPRVYISTRFINSTGAMPGIAHGSYPRQGYQGYDYLDVGFRWADGFTEYPNSGVISGSSSTVAGIFYPEQYYFFHNFRRDMDITQIRAIYSDNTTSWP